jgi:exodeoxyribonuclease V alpha subunit
MAEAPRPQETVEGTVERIVFQNQDTGFAVIRVETKDRGVITAVGVLVGVNEGERLRLTGTNEHDRRFGPQLKITSHMMLRPETLVGLKKYLGSGLVDGIGPSLAERLVDHFGLEALTVIEGQPDRLTEVEGIGPVRAERLKVAWAAQQGVRDVMIFLESAGISPAFAARIHKRFGAQAIEVVKRDPYQLALEVHGIGFKLADRVAAGLGIDRASPRRAAAGVLHALGEASAEGHVFLPRAELVEKSRELLGVPIEIVEEAIDHLVERRHLIADEHRLAPLYLPRLHRAEAESGNVLKSLLQAPKPPALAHLEEQLVAFEQKGGLTLAPEQRAAIQAALKERLSVITGGPGTGKTTLVRGILHLAQAARLRVLLGAPTGRAAKRLFEATGHEASTLHRMLEFNPGEQAFTRGPEQPLEADLVIIDEVSMLDIVLLESLLAAIPLRGQLVLVGDVDQLPSVGPGNVLADLIRSGRVPVARLTRIFRQGEASLITVNAHRINHGELPELGAPGEGALSDFYFIERDEPEELLKAVTTVIAERIPKRFGLNPVRDVQLLTPMHKGPVGAQRLNQELQKLLNPVGPTLERGEQLLRVGDKVMQTRNDYELGVYNGDVGLISSVDAEARIVVVQFDDRTVRYEPADLDALVLAYASTVHKAQGSEYPAVVIVVSTQHFVMLHRRMLYTAVTRGRRLVVLVGSRRALKLAVENRREVTRHSLLPDRLTPT